MGDSLAFDSPGDAPALPIPHIPAAADANDCPVLFAVAHGYWFSFRLRSRAATASFAIRLRSPADNVAALAFPPLLAIEETSASDRFAARAFPPRLPSACAFGFFLCAMRGIILLIGKQVKKKGICHCRCFASHSVRRGDPHSNRT